MSAPDGTDYEREYALGEARAKVLRLARQIASERGVTRDYVLARAMATETYRTLGNPSLVHMNIEQANALARMLERWLNQAKATPRKPTHEISQAPTAPWKQHHNTEE